ncbi:MAG: hypothetical protein IJD48_02795 [Clostridia bacterium]|nr:hypothetical protein [Clostridia bacterium]
MAIVEMSKIKLYGASSDKQKVLDAIFESRLVKLKEVDEIENTTCFFDEKFSSELDAKISKIDRALKLLEDRLPPDKSQPKLYDMKIKEFNNFKSNLASVEDTLNQIDQIILAETETKKQIQNFQNKIKQLVPYKDVSESFADLKNTKNVSVILGTIQTQNLKAFDLFLQDCKYTTYEVVGVEGNIIKVYSHFLESLNVVKKLNELGFNKANFDINTTAKKAISEYESQIVKLEKQQQQNSKLFETFSKDVKNLKIAYDYLSFCQERQQAEGLFRQTQQAFVLEGYLAKSDEAKLEKFLNEKELSISFEFAKLSKNEVPPTLVKNNRVVRQFEFVTNMYSAPKYGEIDPNGILSIFFSIFFGFIMADIGYGLLLAVFGLVLALKQKQKTGTKQLWYVIAIGGIFSIVFGIGFGSFFGLSHENLYLIPQAIIPNPVENVMTLLIACLAAGVVQIMVSFILQGILLIKRKKFLQAICFAFSWDFFFVGLIMFVLDFVGITQGLTLIGLIIAISSVAICLLGQIIVNKGFEKFTKSFGALYGIINMFSDILSYARLFGLMLSGAIIGSIVNQLASSFLLSPITLIIGVIILAIGHSFNLAMGALGAYIHVARLQYIEFFSRFYEGEGELFVPFGSNFSYVNLI